MKKIFTLKVACCALLVALLFSCSGGSKSYTSVISKDVSVIVSVDVASLSEKAGLGDPENDKYKDMLLKEVNGAMTESASSLVDQIIADPSTTGVDFDSPFYMFVPSGDEVSPNVVVKMGDKAKFQAVLDEIIKANELKAIVEGDDFDYSEAPDGSVAIIFNDELILISTQIEGGDGSSAIALGSKIYEASKSENIHDNKAFEKLSEVEGDIKFFTSFDSMPDEIKSQLKATTSVGGVDFTNMTVIGSIGFGLGDINMSLMGYTEDPELQKMFDESLSVTKAMNGDLLKKFPNNSLAIAASYFDGATIVEKLSENPEFTESIARDQEMADVVTAFLQAINGDIALSVVGFNNLTDYTALGYVEMAPGGAEALEALYNNKKINSGIFKKVEDNRYACETRFFSVYIGVKDDLLYISNKKEFPFGENITPSVSETYPNSDGKSLFMAVNVKDLYSVLKAMRLTRSVPSELREPIEQINTFEASITEDGVMNYRVTLLNSDVNSLKLFLDYAKEMVD